MSLLIIFWQGEAFLKLQMLKSKLLGHLQYFYQDHKGKRNQSIPAYSKLVFPCLQASRQSDLVISFPKYYFFLKKKIIVHQHLLTKCPSFQSITSNWHCLYHHTLSVLASLCKFVSTARSHIVHYYELGNDMACCFMGTLLIIKNDNS